VIQVAGVILEDQQRRQADERADQDERGNGVATWRSALSRDVAMIAPDRRR
jgi:hypothetical protein